MCGIVGVVNLNDARPVAEETLHPMLAMIRHRGPDEFGIYCDDRVGLGSARLSIIDLSGRQQPIGNEDGTLWIVFNGEIFNYLELRPELEKRGHRFTTSSDTEVVLHLYEDYGPNCLNLLNGQFVIAIWDTRTRSLFLARDRLGIRPLFYTVNNRHLIFGSEMKAILAHPDVSAEISPGALAQIFTYWSTLSPATIFRDIYSLPPAHYMVIRDGRLSIQPFWSLGFAAGSRANLRVEAALEELESLLIDATLLRLRADVPVGSYLSGGLDSPVTTPIIRTQKRNRLATLSIFFSQAEFDEGGFHTRMASIL